MLMLLMVVTTKRRRTPTPIQWQNSDHFALSRDRAAEYKRVMMRLFVGYSSCGSGLSELLTPLPSLSSSSSLWLSKWNFQVGASHTSGAECSFPGLKVFPSFAALL